MAIRVTQHTMYNSMVGNMQKNLGAYMESVEQGASQKKINRPSDDPAGTYRVLTTRVDMTSTEQYQENVDTAKGCLNLADSVLSTNVATAITGLKTLAEQASTGTYDASQRKIMADQAKQYFGQLLNLANTEFEGKSIFAGHRYDHNAFEQGLAITSWDEDWNRYVNNGGITIDGSSSSTVIVEFTTNPGEKKDLAAGDTFRWSNDGGDTWQTGTVELGQDKDGNEVFVLKPEGSGIYMSIPKEFPDPDDPTKKVPTQITGANPNEKSGPNNGTFLFVRPTAIYQGDDKDPPVDVTLMGAGNIDAKATGEFGKNVLVRIDGQKGADGTLGDVSLKPAGEEFTWSYSTDGGSTWVTAKGKTTGTDQIKLPIPGGYVEIDATANGGKISQGAQIMVHPSRSDLDYEIMKDTYLSVNSVGKDVFGGYYEGKPALEGDNNLFEVVGAFIGYLEGNSQEGCQKTLAALTTAEKQILAEATRIGGMENRLEMAADVLSFQKIDQQERLSYVEDIDLTELLTKLTRQQLTYQTVLQSSSMIMQLSLANYI